LSNFCVGFELFNVYNCIYSMKYNKIIIFYYLDAVIKASSGNFNLHPNLFSSFINMTFSQVFLNFKIDFWGIVSIALCLSLELLK
jgi:hypothetical protein